MQKKISVIIPVYNGEKYISRCINSVLIQKDFSANDIEILIINDGSKDDSLEILKRYESMHPSVIKIINQKNVGVARTRNKGIKLAAGKYIIFIDQDDWIESDYCRVFFDAIESSGVDVVSGGYTRLDAGGRIRQVSSPDTEAEYSKYIIVAAWAKIHRTVFLRQKEIYFFENKFGEDSVFTIKEISLTKKWEQIKYTGYNWFFNETSVSNTLQKKLGNPEVDALMVLLKTLSDTTADKKNEMFQYYILRTCVYYLLFSGRKTTSKEFLAAYYEMRLWIDRNTNLAYLITLQPKGEKFSVKVAIFIFVVLHRLGLIGIFAKIYCRGDDLTN